MRTVLDAADRSAEHEPVLAQLLGHPQRYLLRAAHEAVLLRAALGVEQHLEAAGRVDVEEHVQQRHVLGLGGPDGLEAQLEQHPPGAGHQVAPHPGRRRLRIQAGRVRRLPRGLERHAPRQPVETPLGSLDVDQDERVDARDRARVAAQAAAVLDHVLALAVGGEGLDPERPGERRKPILGRPDPLAAHLDDPAVADVVVLDPAPDALAGLQDHRRSAAGGQLARRRQARETGAHDHHVDLV